MGRMHCFLIAIFTFIGVSYVSAQDIQTGLLRIKNRRASTAYLTSSTAGSAIGAPKVNSGLSQVWVVEPSGRGYTVRNANTFEYLQADFGTPSSVKTMLYIAKDPNAPAYINISSSSNFAGLTCLNLGNDGSTLYKWNNSNDQGSMWSVESVTDFTEDDVRQHFAEQTGYVSELSEDKYYRIISCYGRALTDGTGPGDDLGTLPVDADNLSQYWQLKKDGTGWRIKAVLSERCLLRQTTMSSYYHTTTEANVERFGLKVAFNITPIVGKWETTWTISFEGDAAGLYDSDALSHGAVLGNINEEAGTWYFQEAEVSQEALDQARGGQQAYQDLVTNKAMYQFYLLNLFDDYACTVLKADVASLSDDELAANPYFAALNADMKAMVLKVKNDTWQQYKNATTGYTAGYEKFFRVADYKIYSNYQTMGNADNFTMSNNFGKLSGPTGIVANPGDIIYVYVDTEAAAGTTLQLEAVKTDGVPGDHQTGDVTTLRQGLNLFQFAEQRMLYIFHQMTNAAESLADCPDIKIHIEGGQLNGYWDATRGMTDADWALLQQELLKSCSVLNLKTEHLVFCMNAEVVKQCEPKNMEGLMRIWNTIVENEERYMGVEDFAGRYRNVWNAFSIDYQYMFATSYGTYYNESTLPTIMNYNNMRKAGALWGPSHEMGHNHQECINVIGTTESSNNLFANINTFEQGIQTSRRHLPVDVFYELAQGTPWLQRNIWNTTSMFFQLYLYFHAQHHDDNFLPNLFRKLRQNPIDRTPESNAKGAKDYLHLAKMICDVAQADLSEFFEAYGMFVPVKNMAVSDYINYNVTTSQADINAAKEYMQQYAAKLGNIMFIDDHVSPMKKADANNIFEAIVPANGLKSNNLSQHSEVEAYASLPIGECGDYVLFTKDATAADDDYYTINGNIISFNGTNFAGHKFYDSEGNLVWATNAKSVALPQAVLSIGMENITVKTAYYNMTDAVCTDTKPVPGSVRDIHSGETDGGVFDIAGRRVSQPVRGGIYIINNKKVIIK